MTLYATYAPKGRNSSGLREYIVDYVRGDGGFGGAEVIVAHHRQRGIDAAYAAASSRAAAHGLRLERVALFSN